MSLHGEMTMLGRRHLRRRCVRCGLPADALGAGEPACPRCGCDLGRRPARSYAEMEGLFELEPAPSARDEMRRLRADAAAARWLVTVCAVAAASTAALAAAIVLAAR